jgi:hypothetical protein
MNKIRKKGFAPNYKRQVHPFIQRIIAIRHLLTNRNFILLTEIKEFVQEGKPGRIVRVIPRTDYDIESDYLSCCAGAEIIMKSHHNQ